MATEKLFYIDQYRTEETAHVLSCEEVKGGYAVVLDRTIFYPTGGGQPCDLGTLGEATVTDVFERDEEIIHLCDRPLPVGETVTGKIDFDRRFTFMQQHSGEHLVSGVVHRRFGYENVGFHMGSDCVTFDFSGEISAQELKSIEREVNEIIYQNIKTEFLYPDEASLHTYPFRSKKELSGWVRLVKFGDADLCACCGLHVAATGEIGLVKLLSTTKFHEGSRIEMLAGIRALDYMNALAEQNREISNLLSAKPFATAAAVKRVSEELASAQYRVTELENRLFAVKAAQYAGSGDVLLFESAMSPDALRCLTDAVMQACGGRCAVFSGEDGNYKYAVGQGNGDLRDMTKALNAALNGRGGGKPFFVQGSVAASKKEIEAFFAAL
ncbi:MAG: alanyl-tRNA editing protein [Oscillospiraceae bacterium]|nr:alanyl-tRNA editing protein [Oscillospiraceae bacterium]